MINIIHVGKSGGSSIEFLFKKNNIKYKNIHVHNSQEILSEKDENILLLRDPVTRVLSVFNFWLKVSNDKTHTHYKPYLKNIFDKNNDINLFFENIYSDKSKMSIINNLQHFKEGLYYYCKDKNNTKKINKVIRQEHFNSDVEKVFKLKNNFRIWDTSDMSKNISEKSLINIKKYTQNDYIVIDWLLEFNLISKEYIKKFK